MEFDENQISDDEEEDDEMDIPYESTGNSLPPATAKPSVTRYRECLKNHAIAVGGHAVDGCGEFLPSGEQGTIASLKCAACNCHRNFHRKETQGERPLAPHSHHHIRQIHHHYRTPPPAGYLQNHHQQHTSGHGNTTPVSLHRRTIAVAGHSRDNEQDVMSNPGSSGGGGGGNSSGGGGTGSSRKRYRTKFTGEQKDKMLGFAERLGWRIQKHDEASVEQFCQETSIKRHVLKVWMHNNKHTLGKKNVIN